MRTVKSIVLFFICGIAVLYSQRAEALNCTITPNNLTLNFGVINQQLPTVHEAEISQSVLIKCSKRGLGGGYINVCMYIGDGSGADGARNNYNVYNPRYMKNNNNYMGYQIYKDDETTPWGNRDASTNGPRLVSIKLQYIPWSVPVRYEGSASFKLRAKTNFKPATSYNSSYYWVASGNYNSSFASGSGHTLVRIKKTPRQPNPANILNWCNGSGFSEFEYPIEVKAKVEKQCRITSATGANTGIQNIGTLDFGDATDLSPSSTEPEVEGQMAFNVQCTKNTPYRIGLNKGIRGNRTMKHSAAENYVRYELYKDSDRKKPWGNDLANGTNTQDGEGTGAKIPYTAFGKVPKGADQNPIATATNEKYEDIVTITVQY